MPKATTTKSAVSTTVYDHNYDQYAQCAAGVVDDSYSEEFTIVTSPVHWGPGPVSLHSESINPGGPIITASSSVYINPGGPIITESSSLYINPGGPISTLR